MSSDFRPRTPRSSALVPTGPAIVALLALLALVATPGSAGIGGPPSDGPDVTVYQLTDIGNNGATPPVHFMVMEYIEGQDLQRLVDATGVMPYVSAANYIAQASDGLDHAHAMGLIHRDIKPANLLVNPKGIVKILDLGLAKFEEDDSKKASLTVANDENVMGTADYLAPEIIKRQATDHRVDVFALGVTAFEIFTGQLPWERSLSSEETLRRHLNTPPRDPKDLSPELDDDLCAVLRKAIARERTDRYPSASALKDALNNLERDDY